MSEADFDSSRILEFERCAIRVEENADFNRNEVHVESYPFDFTNTNKSWRIEISP
jgi:hypothetical protein